MMLGVSVPNSNTAIIRLSIGASFDGAAGAGIDSPTTADWPQRM
jgi:hypothetical protein